MKVAGMTHDELKALLAEWYEAGRNWEYGRELLEPYMDVTQRLREYARTLYESGKAEVTE